MSFSALKWSRRSPSRGTRSISRQPSNSLIELETFERARPSTSAISSAWSGRSEMKSKAWICATERLTPHCPPRLPQWRMNRSEEHTSELQTLMRISYDVFCLKKTNHYTTNTYTQPHTHH